MDRGPSGDSRNKRAKVASPIAASAEGYRFTNEHVAEIVRIFEVRPTDVPASHPAVVRGNGRNGPIWMLARFFSYGHVHHAVPEQPPNAKPHNMKKGGLSI